MGCCASTSRKAPISARTVPTRLRPWRPPSTPGPERRLLGKHPQKHLTSCFNQTTKTVLRRPLESALATLVGIEISGLPYWASAASTASRQKSTARVIDTRQDSTLRLNQSTTAAR